METEIIITYVVCDDVIKSLKIEENVKLKMNTAEIMTTAIIPAIQYYGNLEKARKELSEHGYIKDMLSKSQLNTRSHAIIEPIWKKVLAKLTLEFASHNKKNEFMVNSLPISSCKLARQKKTKLYKNKKYLGYCTSKKDIFIGFKGHVITDINDTPFHFMFSPGSKSDIRFFKKMNFELPKNSFLYADKAYNECKYEDYLAQKNIFLLPIRKKNSKRPSQTSVDKIRKKKGE